MNQLITLLLVILALSFKYGHAMPQEGDSNNSETTTNDKASTKDEAVVNNLATNATEGIQKCEGTNCSDISNADAKVAEKRVIKTCESSRKMLSPQQNRNNEIDSWDLVPQTESSRTTLLVEICENAGQSCNFGGGVSNLMRTKTFCKQNYIDRIITVFDTNSNRFMSKLFKVPSSCSCIYRI